ncbi:hypothetical protein PR202_gb20744 [Eleusine coracana subsp. coracana]|uniref:Coatomer subunit delta n=1 Tax=Eleusine coracana subsp. coracana TaxID=191504 RepID=A0AAV5FBI5_ELECO|nr:hypothetical protein PR202_gb20744 [Eleusine coracana subsp. coracana]
MKLGKTQKTNQFLESLKAEGEIILEDVQPSSVPSRSTSLASSDPVTVTIEEKLNVIVKKDGGINNFDVQVTLALQVLNDAEGFTQLQIAISLMLFGTFSDIFLLYVVNCWPSVSGNEAYANIEYEASEIFDLHNIVISIPLPALREAPSVRQIDGEWK